MTPKVTVDAIAVVTRDIFATVLADGGDLLSGDRGSGEIVSTVEITGAWNGTVCLSCSVVAGRHAASAMFDMEDSELSPAEISDAVGELVNMVGGNIKSLLPGPTQLSLPTVHSEGPFELPGHLELANEVMFSWTAEPVVVTLWNRTS